MKIRLVFFLYLGCEKMGRKQNDKLLFKKNKIKK